MLSLQYVAKLEVKLVPPKSLWYRDRGPPRVVSQRLRWLFTAQREMHNSKVSRWTLMTLVRTCEHKGRMRIKQVVWA